MNYFCRLLPPRPSFARDMSEEEAALMQEHALHWRAGLERGSVLAFGLVADPRGAFGIGIVDFPSDAEARAFTDADPTVRSGRGFAFEVLPMPRGLVRA